MKGDWAPSALLVGDIPIPYDDRSWSSDSMILKKWLGYYDFVILLKQSLKKFDYVSMYCYFIFHNNTINYLGVYL